MGVDVAAMLQDMFDADSVLEVDDPLHQLPALPSSSTKPADVRNDGKTRNGNGRSRQSLKDDSNENQNKSKKAPKVRNIKVSCLGLGAHCLAHHSFVYHLTDTVNGSFPFSSSQDSKRYVKFVTCAISLERS